MKNSGLDTHRSFNTSSHNPSRPPLTNYSELISSSYRNDMQYQKLLKMVPAPTPKTNKNYPRFQYISPNKLGDSKFEKITNNKIRDRKSIAKNINNSEKILPKRQEISSSYKGLMKGGDYGVGGRKIDLESSYYGASETLLYHSNVTQYKQSSGGDVFRGREKKLGEDRSQNPSTKSINGSDVVDKDFGDGENFGYQGENQLAKSSFNEQQKYGPFHLKLKPKHSDQHPTHKPFFDDYASKPFYYNKQRLVGYPKIQNMKTERSNYQTGFLKKGQDLNIRPRKQTNTFEYSKSKKQDNSSLKLIPKLQKIEDLKYDIAVLSTRHPSLYIPPQEKKMSIKDFEVGKSLGHGRFGKVYHAVHKATGALVALKKIPKEMIKVHKLENQLTLEIKIQTYLNHPNIVKMFGVISEKDNVYMILEHMEQGSLYECLKKRGKLLTEKEVANIIKSIVCAIRYLHDLNVVHRDLKPQNILISSGVCKLADFGWAALCNERRKTNCGTLDYYAPEILEGEDYDETIDLWCIGVLTFELLTGKVPFYHASKKETVRKIIKVEKMDFPARVSDLARDFTESLLVKEPSKRLSVNKLLSHGFITKNCQEKY